MSQSSWQRMQDWVEEPESPEFADFEYLDESLEICPVPSSNTFSPEQTPVAHSPLPASRNNQKRKCRTEFFSPEEKKALAAAVKARPVIWDLADAEHYNNNAIKLAWKQIGSELSRTRTKILYALGIEKISFTKRSSTSGIRTQRPPSDVEWEFAEDLAFLPDISRKRKTMTTAKDDSLVVDEERSEPTLEPTGSSSNYFYQTGPSKNTKEDEAVTFLATNINHLISVQRSSIAQPASAEDDQIKHKTALTNIDRMLQKLPDDVVEDVLFDITSLVYRKIREYRPQPF